MFDAEQLERNARKAIDAAMAAQINIDLFDDIIPVADCCFFLWQKYCDSFEQMP